MSDYPPPAKKKRRNPARRSKDGNDQQAVPIEERLQDQLGEQSSETALGHSPFAGSVRAKNATQAAQVPKAPERRRNAVDTLTGFTNTPGTNTIVLGSELIPGSDSSEVGFTRKSKQCQKPGPKQPNIRGDGAESSAESSPRIPKARKPAPRVHPGRRPNSAKLSSAMTPMNSTTSSAEKPASGAVSLPDSTQAADVNISSLPQSTHRQPGLSGSPQMEQAASASAEINKAMADAVESEDTVRLGDDEILEMKERLSKAIAQRKANQAREKAQKRKLEVVEGGKAKKQIIDDDVASEAQTIESELKAELTHIQEQQEIEVQEFKKTMEGLKMPALEATR